MSGRGLKDNMDGHIKFIDLDVEGKEILLHALGYTVDEDGYIVDEEKNELYKDPIDGEEVHIEDASILPGSTIIINTTPLSLSEYITRYIEEN